MFKVQFMTVSGKFTTAKTENYKTFSEAENAVEKYAKDYGFDGITYRENIDDYSGRFTVKTSAGRSGRNIAFIDSEYDGESE